MTQSMTAFARKEIQQEWGTLVWEIRSVNHRYLEPILRLPDNLRELETGLREKLRQQLSRGKVECTLRFQAAAGQGSMVINEPLLQSLLDACDQVQTLLPKAGKLNPLEVLQWPGVLQSSEHDLAEVQAEALDQFDEALAELVQGRQREGGELAQLILQRLTAMSSIVAKVRDLLPAILERQRQQLLDKFAELQIELDPTRLEQEMVLLAQKADVAEELDRLDTHIQEVKRVLRQSGSIGRRLDFLMQELNREANTLSSKSIVADTTQQAVELKVLIEQMREQVQNIE
ncbi:YicC family protein [Pokkaliibacter sp. MBI-7]|uniref:YicC family protein n=1 Tax=Proteobacteria bacterium 228 TaxID=2083153 RepID=A0A2S5KSU1_9PROT|nr:MULTISPECIES: YicC/YloC family endoribonuclease [Pokkaliibacter]MDH2433254.1 YicC family protein [Pokkaliibacter sp. MBI-7]PPC77742.1 YicC family protein [Pokkaliibacter plantistimulans]